MSVGNYIPDTPAGLVEDDDGIRIMPTSDDLTKPSSDAEFIKKALAEEMSNHSNLIASSRQTLPKISINGVALDPKAVAAEAQYHPADSQEEALFLAAQALVLRELLRQAVVQHLGETAWQADEETAIATLIEQQVVANAPDTASCLQYYNANKSQFVSTPIMKVRHILLASPPQEGEERIELKKQACQLIEKLKNSPTRNSDFIELARQYSACPSKDDGGELGILQKGGTVPEFETAVFALPVGVGVNPIETRYGIHVVEVLQKQDGKLLDFDEAYPMIENRLKQQSFHHGLCDYLFRLSKQADIVGIELQMNEQNVYRGE
ncbi:peptidylprolyl isomerase [Moraxella marmotae]|uniref:peptidylprolyl isomerase n=1 Tax=Moraxella marmotae TaxID=3344520 RepID=UPI0035F42EC1